MDDEVDQVVAQAERAQRAFGPWPEARVDALLHDIATTIAAHADELAVATVVETGIGNAEDKTLKNRFASLAVYQSLAGQPAAGVIRADPTRQVAEIASPVGVVLGLIPRTSPVATLVFKTLIALKGRNALVLSCHHRAQGVGERAGTLIQAALRRHGAPPALVQWVRQRTSRATTLQLMRHRDVGFILATGGVSLVRAAYSSGTPAIGVGPGNAPAYVCADADVEAATQHIVASKTFDHGLICGAEQHLVVDSAVRDRLMAALEMEGAAVLTLEEARGAEARLCDSTMGRLRGELVGQAAGLLAEQLGIRRPWPVHLIVIPVDVAAIAGALGGEKLAPVLSFFTVAGEREGLAVCQALLHREGRGHTAIIHSGDPARVAQFGQALEASRILVNGPGAQGCIGMGNGLVPSLTLGCGTFGGTSTTDNVSYTHLLNIKRVAYHQQPLAHPVEYQRTHGESDQRAADQSDATTLL
ncbi:MAG: aldehyde dehydrogenase family protein [Chloroflexales bacterium]|nr:aldehyde dehydrogenase family protein [Chloroflexales bacterium]